MTATAVWLTRFYTQYTGTAPTNAQLTTFDASIATAYTANLRALCDAPCVLTQIESADLSSATGAVDTSAVSIAGTRATANALPAQVCMVNSYEISRRYRGGHPRGYWRQGVPADLATDQTWAAAFISAVNTGMSAFYTAIAAAGWTAAGTLTHVNVSYYNGFTVVINPITGRARNVPTLRVSPVIDTVSSVVARTSIGTQRRREAFVD